MASLFYLVLHPAFGRSPDLYRDSHGVPYVERSHQAAESLLPTSVRDRGFTVVEIAVPEPDLSCERTMVGGQKCIRINPHREAWCDPCRGVDGGRWGGTCKMCGGDIDCPSCP